ncbi:MAG TPA: acetyl-CoA carboxylase, carboxyltransferase subunit beta [Clostridia bacterium]
MIKRYLFKKPQNSLEGSEISFCPPKISDDLCCNCPSCKKIVFLEDLKINLGVCPICSKHLKIKARERINYIADPGTFFELFSDLKSSNFLAFPDYDYKLSSSRSQSGEQEAVITGVCEINGLKACLFAMEPFFMMGSMGVVVGEKITRLFEYAAQNNLAVIGFTLSGGARMQEGMLSLMQMAKISAAIERHSKKGLLYTAILCDPTAGGVTASFAMGADIIAAEPEALICFAGPRVIEQTIRQKLPPNFQKAEFLLEKGFIDIIVPRMSQKKFLTDMLKMHIVAAGDKEHERV